MNVFGNAGLLLGGALLLGTVSAPASAQTSGYLLDQRGAVVKSPNNLCWRTGYWSPAMATAECDPDLVPKKPAAPPPIKKPAPPAKPPAPAPRAKPPAPAPRVTPVTQKVTLSADALFDFDKSVIRPDGRTRLDELVGRIKGVSVETIIAIGHADRIGSNAYNMKLSQRRADSVKAYLVSKGIPANRIHTEGRGEKEPVTKPGQCKGTKKTPKLVACLQPDRRVVIEVVGTRSSK
ncbi:MAG: OmpA family protein [Betaproteobacteria bacterium]|nr:OmpA family protein [Betaproteobacteria bacterium]